MMASLVLGICIHIKETFDALEVCVHPCVDPNKQDNADNSAVLTSSVEFIFVTFVSIDTIAFAG